MRVPASEVESGLATAEQRGLRLALLGRSVALTAALAWLVPLSTYPEGLPGIAIVTGLLGLGLLHLWLLKRGRERLWHRFLLPAIDFTVLAWLAATQPILAGGDVPQILLFRAYGVAAYLFVFVALAALSLSPLYVLWVTGLAIVALWSVFIYAAAQVDAPLSWVDLPANATAAQYQALILDPNFLGRGNRFEETIALALAGGLIAVGVRRARQLVRQRAAAEAERRRALEVFGNYVPPAIARRLVEAPEALAPHSRQASILILDIAGFTRLAERRPPEALLPLLNAFFERCGQCVGEAGGVMLSYVGDGFLAAFNVAEDTPDHAACAMAAGLALCRSAAEPIEGEHLRIRIGIASGPVAAGSVGGSQRRSYTVYGDTVNLAQRLEALCKETGAMLLASEASWRHAGAPAGWQRVGPLAARGREATVVAYRPPA
ncbi:MAG TPA: adenylate/guanylate cyclase domain-containing protein [Kiloniellales bacterium]|nr:adenylate/guanylate cyclase domain-containing protein [Kiloniellales bacterium]